MFRTIIFKLVLGLYFVIWAPILLVGLISYRTNRFFVRTCADGVMLLARIVAGIRWCVHYPQTCVDGIPALPDNNARLDGKAIVAAKHMSIMEIAVINHVIPNAFFIVKRELMWIPIYGWAFWRMGLLPVNRARGATNMNKLAARVAQKIMDGQTLVIFPEGTRVKPGARPALRRGLLFLAGHLKLPILPVGTDAGLYWPKRGRMHPGTVNVWFEPMLPCNATLDEISAAINRHSA